MLQILQPKFCNTGQQTKTGKTVSGTFVGCVLWLRGESLAEQPIADLDGNILLWNGDIFDHPSGLDFSSVSDTQVLSQRLKDTVDADIPLVLFTLLSLFIAAGRCSSVGRASF